MLNIEIFTTLHSFYQKRTFWKLQAEVFNFLLWQKRRVTWDYYSRAFCKQKQCNALTDPCTQAKQKSAILHNCWLGVALHTVHHWLNLPLRPESNPWAQSRRRVFVLTSASHRPPASCVCATETTPLCPTVCCIPPVSVCVFVTVCGGEGHNRPSPAGCWIQADMFQSNILM